MSVLLVYVDMQRYWWPGYEMQLLGELQRQQNSAEFCDTLLQTEGISVPTHSCVLAALSPYLFQKLSTSPSPPCGQKRRLQLQSVKAHTLLKVVGLLYSGKLEVTGSLQQSDVLAVARQFGIADLAEGQKDGMAKEGQLQEKRQRAGSCSDTGFYGSERGESRKMWDAQVQAELAGERETYSPAENRRYVSTGTQTVKAVEKSVESFVNFFGQTTHSAPESVPSVAPNLDFSAMWEPQIITLDKQLCFTSGPVIPSMPNGATNDGESTSGQSSGSVINPKSIPALSNNMTAFPVPLTGDSNPFTSLRSYGCGDSTQVLAEKATGLENGNPNDEMADRRENREQPSHASRDETVGEERGRCAEVVHAPASEGVRGPSLVKQMQQMVETTHISIKVKLRRRTKGETWEVVSMQDPDETEPFAFQRQDGSNHREPQTDLMPTTQPPPSAVDVSVVCKPDAPILLPATTGTPKLPPQSSPSSDSQPPSSDCFTPNQNDGVEAALLPQPQDSVEESDEQLEKLLEDIMIGLNILPNLERDCKASLHPQPSHDRVESSCQVLDSQNEAEDSQMHTAVSAAVCALCQDLGTQSQQSSANTGSPCCFTAHNQPDSSLFVQPSAVLLQQQQCSAQYHSSVMSMGHRDGLSQQSMPLTKSQEHLQPEEPTTRPALPSALFSAGQKLHYPAFQESSSQDNQHAFEFVPLITGNETQSLHTVFLPCMDDLGLPRCLSPLGPCTSATKHHAALNNPANLGYKIQQQPSPHVQPWLTENPGSLQFPLSAITHRKNASVSLSQDTKCSCWTQRCQEHLAPNPQNGGTWTESCAVKKVKRGTTICAGQQNGKGLEYDPRKMKESLKCKEGDMIGDAIAPKKRRHPSHSQHAANYPIAYKNVKVSDGTMGQMNLSVCSVSLSSNNVLVNEREMAASSITRRPGDF
uniref:uncharacterized protein LOC109957942 n=1 Tax=Monopterus albus TaxID=43700 RepID=UPI0009B3F7BF|nr:uncharacterized protein LOC109957942 [Monopterus albus]